MGSFCLFLKSTPSKPVTILSRYDKVRDVLECEGLHVIVFSLRLIMLSWASSNARLWCGRPLTLTVHPQDFKIPPGNVRTSIIAMVLSSSYLIMVVGKKQW